MSLASKLPWNHRFSGGFSGIGSQPLPTDADALDYLSRMATTDGAGVETGVAVAVDAFFRAVKDAGIYSDLKACCILAGARTITGALVPLAGTAPTAQGGWASGDYSRTEGLTGDANALYLDTNRAGDADPQDDSHAAVFCTSLPSTAISTAYISNVPPSGLTGATLLSRTSVSPNNNGWRLRSSAGIGDTSNTGLLAASRASASEFWYSNGQSVQSTLSTSEARPTTDFFIFASAGGTSLQSDATIAFYSIGESLGNDPESGLAALDTAVTNLINRLKFALLVGENPSGLDPDTIDYIVRGYEAGGTLE